jgi:hypothetical protein
MDELSDVWSASEKLSTVTQDTQDDDDDEDRADLASLASLGSLGSLGSPSRGASLRGSLDSAHTFSSTSPARASHPVLRPSSAPRGAAARSARSLAAGDGLSSATLGAWMQRHAPVTAVAGRTTTAAAAAATLVGAGSSPSRTVIDQRTGKTVPPIVTDLLVLSLWSVGLCRRLCGVCVCVFF